MFRPTKNWSNRFKIVVSVSLFVGIVIWHFATAVGFVRLPHLSGTWIDGASFVVLAIVSWVIKSRYPGSRLMLGTAIALTVLAITSVAGIYVSALAGLSFWVGGVSLAVLFFFYVRSLPEYW